MSDDIRFTQKKVDESWKDQVVKEKSSAPASSSSSSPSSKSKPVTSQPFLSLLSSLGYQAMMHLGEVPYAETGEKETNLQAAREMIDLLIAIKNKTAGNLSDEEMQAFETLLPELQMKFAGKA